MGAVLLLNGKCVDVETFIEGQAEKRRERTKKCVHRQNLEEAQKSISEYQDAIKILRDYYGVREVRLIWE